MHLQSVAVEHYRGIRSAAITFDATTVVIGEDDCGRVSLIEALAFVLDPSLGDCLPDFQTQHFHHPGSRPVADGPLRITMRFAERRAGEWDAYLSSDAGHLLQSQGTGLRQLQFDLSATESASGTPRIQCELARPDLPSRAVLAGPESLAWLRQVKPLVHLRRGSLVGTHEVAGKPARRPRSLSPDMARLAARIQASHAAVVSGTAVDVNAEVTDGFEAAREFVARAGHHLGGTAHNFRQIVADIVESQRLSPVPSASPQFSGSSAERIGVLALIAALVDALPDSLAPAADPIWLIEDPEAHLHPMTLAAVLKLVGHVKWQKLITTQSGEVLAAEPLKSLRRLTRTDGVVREWRVRPRALSAVDLRRVGYHLRQRRGMASFARCWLLVEGETEFWLLPELARVMGYDFVLEGIVCVEFAQAGASGFITLARELGIEWHVLVDGDSAGRSYADQASRFAARGDRNRRVTMLEERDIEHCFYANGYEPLFRRLAGQPDPASGARRVIARAIDKRSKPMLALDLVVAAAERGSHGVPAPVARLIQTCVELARTSPFSAGDAVRAGRQ